MKAFLRKCRGPLLAILMAGHACTAQTMALVKQTVRERPDGQRAPGTVRLKDALHDLGKKFKVTIVYESTTVEGFNVDRLMQSGSLEMQLEHLLEPLGLGYTYKGKRTYVIQKKKNDPSAENKNNVSYKDDHLLRPAVIPLPGIPDKRVTLDPASLPESQDREIRGSVIDETGEGLPGVSVIQKGTQRGTITDVTGNFRLSIPDAGPVSILFSFVGFVSQEIVVNSQSEIKITLLTDTKALDELVVIGYGSQKKRDITGSVASIPQDKLEMVPNLNITQAIQGAVPGVMVQQSSGGAAPNASVMIRGRNSILASNEPLIIVDGIPYYGQIRDINVNDVKSIEVLKDASAAAIYGSRGANGVILITTKNGGKGKPLISYDGRYSVQRFTNLPQTMSGEEFYRFKEIREPGQVTASEQEIYNSGHHTDWVKLALRNGASQQHNLSVAGGTESIKYYVGGGYLKVKGLSLTDNYDRATSRINLDTKIASWLTVGTRTQLSFEDRSGSPIDWTEVFRANPLTAPYTAEGKLTSYPWPEFNDIPNPLEPVNYLNSNKSYQVLSNNFINIDLPFLPGLNYRLNTGIARQSAEYSTYRGRNTKAGLESRGSSETGNSGQQNTVIENILSYNRVKGSHSFGATAVYSYERRKSNGSVINASGFPNDFLTSYAAGQAELVVPSYTFNETTLISQMLRLNYSFRERYLLTLTSRRDGYSAFGADHKWGLFPSAALGWNITEESFFPWKNVFQELKFRASFGLNGNQALDSYETISRLAEQNIVALGVTQPGYIPSKLGQNTLGWESSKTLNLGIDFSALENRLSGDINLYKTNTFDLLLNRSISAVHGITTITQNIGETQNTGFELGITSRNYEGKEFQWVTSGNLAWVRNKILSLYGELDENGKETDDIANAWFIGHPISVNFDYVWDGIWQLNETEQAQVWRSQPGFVKLKDINGDGQLTGIDRQIIGQRDPKLIWGVTNTFTFKGIGLTVFVQGVSGVTKLNEFMADTPTSSQVRRNVVRKNWWTPENPNNEWYKNDINAHMMGGISAKVYENAGFVRVRDISLSYDLPGKLTGKLGLQKLRLYTTGRNLATFTGWRGIDPELDNGRGTIPLQKELVFGLNASF